MEYGRKIIHITIILLYIVLDIVIRHTIIAIRHSDYRLDIVVLVIRHSGISDYYCIVDRLDIVIVDQII